MNYTNGDKIDLTRFITDEGVKYYYIDGNGAFKEFDVTSSVSELVPEYYALARVVLQVSETILLIPSPSPNYDISLSEFYIINNDLQVNTFLADTWGSYDLDAYRTEIELSTDSYLPSLDTFQKSLKDSQESLTENLDFMTTVKDELERGGSSSEIIDMVQQNIDASTEAIFMLAALRESVITFINSITV
jgi:hypothetical protein